MATREQQHQKKKIWLEGINAISVCEVTVSGVRRVLMFVGETHFPFPGLSFQTVKGCSSIGEDHEKWDLRQLVIFLQDLLPPQKKLDIFLEHTFPLGKGQKLEGYPFRNKGDSFTSFLTSNYSQQLILKGSPKSTHYAPSQKEKNKLRVHNIDIRDGLGLTRHLQGLDKSYERFLPIMILHYLEWKRDRGSVSSLELFFDEFLKDTELQGPENILERWKVLLKLEKQWQGIQDTFWKDSLERWLMDMSSTFVKELKEFQEHYRKGLHSYLQVSKSKRFGYLQIYMNIFINIHKTMLSKLVDFYCLCRVFRTFSDGKTTEFGLIVTGYAHFFNMIQFLRSVGKEYGTPFEVGGSVTKHFFDLCVEATTPLTVIANLFSSSRQNKEGLL